MTRSGAAIELEAFLSAIRADYSVSAPVMWELAGIHCFTDPATGSSCKLYHGTYQYFMLLDLKRGILNDSRFIISQVRELAIRDNCRRILITGTADYSMLAHIAWAFRSTPSRPEITVVDRCQTALSINAWYARKYSLEINLVRSDLFEYDAPWQYDAICTHNILNFFSFDDRLRLTRKWHDLLRPGGCVVTMTRLRLGSDDKAGGFTPQQVSSIYERTYQAATEYGSGLGIEPGILAGVAEEFADDYKRFMWKGEEDVHDCFNNAGLQLITPATASVSLQTPDLHVSPGARSAARLLIVARKPVKHY